MIPQEHLLWFKRSFTHNHLSGQLLWSCKIDPHHHELFFWTLVAHLMIHRSGVYSFPTCPIFHMKSGAGFSQRLRKPLKGIQYNFKKSELGISSGFWITLIADTYLQFITIYLDYYLYPLTLLWWLCGWVSSPAWNINMSMKRHVGVHRRIACGEVENIVFFQCAPPWVCLLLREALKLSLPQITEWNVGRPVTASALMVFRPCNYTQRTGIQAKPFSPCLTCKAENSLLM